MCVLGNVAAPRGWQHRYEHASEHGQHSLGKDRVHILSPLELRAPFLHVRAHISAVMQHTNK
jgi:hypothetical protein